MPDNRKRTSDQLSALGVLDEMDPQSTLKDPIRAWVRELPEGRAHSLALSLASVARSKDKPFSWLSAALKGGYALEEAEKALADRVVVEGASLDDRRGLEGLLLALYVEKYGEQPPPKLLTPHGGLGLQSLSKLDEELYKWVKRTGDRAASREVAVVERDGVRYECVPDQTPAFLAEAIRRALERMGRPL